MQSCKLLYCISLQNVSRHNYDKKFESEDLKKLVYLLLLLLQCFSLLVTLVFFSRL